VQFPNYSDERYILCNVAHIFLPLLYVYGNHKSNIDKAQKAFNAGQWEKSWNRAQSNAAIRRVRLEENPAIKPQDLMSRKLSMPLLSLTRGT
jgi:hypothetical protein